jgi:hypothetical protein
MTVELGPAPSEGAEDRKQPPTRRGRWVAAGVAIAVLGAGLSIAFDNSSSDAVIKPLPGDQWRDGVLNDMARMSQGTLDYIRVINDWRDGKADAAQVRQSATETMDKYLEARDLLANRAAFPQAPRALQDYRDTVQLYIVHTRLAILGSEVSDPRLRRQVQRLLGRVRYLADRVYDLGNDEMGSFIFHSVDIDGFEYERPADVPSFAKGALAPGPPLAPVAQAKGPARVYEKTRPEQPWEAWAQAVRDAAVPSPDLVTRSIGTANVNALQQVAAALTAASDRIHDAADPQGQRGLSSRVQLGLLVQTEALRVAQVGRLVPRRAAEATEIAEVLALIGNAMWDDRLGPRSLGFPAGLLTVRPATAPPPVASSPAIPSAPPG